MPMTKTEIQAYLKLKDDAERLRDRINGLESQLLTLKYKTLQMLPDCPDCKGKGTRLEYDDERGYWSTPACGACHRTGKAIPPEVLATIELRDAKAKVKELKAKVVP